MQIILTETFLDNWRKLTRARWHPANIWRRLKARWRRCTTIKPRYLSHEWYDRDVLLAHMMFEILSQFVEKECSPGCVEWHGPHGRKITVNGQEKFVRDEIQELYDWWHKDYQVSYPAIKEAIWQQIQKIDSENLIGLTRKCGELTVWDPQYKTEEAKKDADTLYASLTKLDSNMEVELAARLHRILNIREHMWT